MDFGQPFRALKRVDIGPLLGALAKVDEAAWDGDADLRAKLAPYRHTKSIYLYHSFAQELPLGARPLTQADVRPRAGWAHFIPATQPILDELLADYPAGGVIVRCQLSRLAPGGVIAPHKDSAPLLRLSHRVHVPLITYPEVKFLIDGVDRKFGAGEAFELNNQHEHSVENPTPHPRTHLIFDYLPRDFDARILEKALT